MDEPSSVAACIWLGNRLAYLDFVPREERIDLGLMLDEEECYPCAVYGKHTDIIHPVTKQAIHRKLDCSQCPLDESQLCLEMANYFAEMDRHDSKHQRLTRRWLKRKFNQHSTFLGGKQDDKA